MKKISLIVLSFITIICCLCACGNSSSQSTDNKPSTSNKTTASDVSESGSKSSQGDTVVVPNVVGMNKDEAVKKLEGLGLIVEVEKKYPNKDEEITKLKAGSVVEQNPSKTTKCKKNSTIKIGALSLDSEFSYETNQDGTISIYNAYFWGKENGAYIIPKEYNGFKVTKVYIDTLTMNYFLSNQSIIKVPNEVEILGYCENVIEKY